METVWINGKYVPKIEAQLPIEDRSILFGDGIYEVIAAYDGTPILLEEHLDRWERSAEDLRIPQAWARDVRVDVINNLLHQLHAPRATVYGQLSRGPALRSHIFPKNPLPTEFWFARILPEHPASYYSQGVKAITHPDERWKRCSIKSTSLLANCLAKQAAIENGVFESILYLEDGTVTEASVANFHVVKNGAIYTHPTNGRILGGCKRAMMIRLAREIGIRVREEKFNLDFLRTADEAFLTSTTLNVLPVTTIDGKAVAEGTVGPLTRRLIEAVTAEIHHITAAHAMR